MAAWAIIVLSWNGREDTLACLDSLARLASDGIEVICVDNGSTDGTVPAVRAAHPEVTVIENGRNLGFAGGNDVGIAHAMASGAEWIVLLNNDATLEPRAIEALRAAACRHPEAGILGGKLLFAEPPDRIWFAGQRVRLRLGYSGRPYGYGQPDSDEYRREREVDRVVGALMAVSRRTIETVGALDEDLFAYVEDVEWCVRARRAGFAVRLVPTRSPTIACQARRAANSARRTSSTTACATRSPSASGTRRCHGR